MKFKCSNGHENMAHNLPERCPVCGSSLLRVISGGATTAPVPPSLAKPATPAVPTVSSPAAPAPSAAPVAAPVGTPNPIQPVPANPPVTPPPVKTGGGLPVKPLVFGLAGVVILIIAVAVMLGRHPGGKPPAATGQPNEPVAPGQTQWKPVVTMGGEIFPSYLVASSTMNPDLLPKSKAVNTLGDATGIMGVTITSPADNTKVKVTFEANTIMQASSLEVQLPRRGETYFIYPKIKFLYDALLHTRQAVPLTVVADVAVNDQSPEQQSLTVRLNSINDCPFAIKDTETRLDWMFAAYVNENHPWSEEVRKEALKTGIIQAFDGYPGNLPEAELKAEVLNQVFSIWHVFQKRGFKYSNVTSSSSENGLVALQQVRFVDQSIQGSQANCADGSVLFASVLRQIGIEPFLVQVPGHMFVGFYASEDLRPNNVYFLETTMMGEADLSRVAGLRGAGNSPDSQDEAAEGRFAGLRSLRQKIEGMAQPSPAIKTSMESFFSALSAGADEYKEANAKNAANIISIRQARHDGVMPIAYQP